MEAWVTDAGSDLVPLEFRFHVSMCGSLGVGANLLHWSEEERDLAARLIAQYKEIRSLVQLGDQYRLISPEEHAYSAVQYVDKAKAESVLFIFRTYLPDPAQLPQIYLRGLDPQARYEVEGFGICSGAAWMSAGLFVPLKNLQSKLVRIRKSYGGFPNP
jgi:alpha-galactosidase